MSPLFLYLGNAGVILLCFHPQLTKSWSIQYKLSFPRRAEFGMSMPTSSPGPIKPSHVVIAGAGVIGTSTAYYLAHMFGISCTVVDQTGHIAPAASGKAGGFLALDWNDDSPTGELTRRSFALHQELADALGADNLQYRRLTCSSVAVNDFAHLKPSGKKLEGLEWAADAMGVQSLGDERTIAQVHPKKLCDNLWRAASKCKEEGGVGSTLVKGKVAGPVYEDGRLVGARLDDGTILAADALLFACGPWTANIMTGVKYHSVLIPTERTLSQCVFFSGCGDPEVYVRPDNTAYCTGFPDSAIRVTEHPGEEEVRQEAVDAIVAAVRTASGGSDNGAALSAVPQAANACYLPMTPDGLPIMGLLPEDSVGGGDCYIATGHSCWGILLGPATGESMATLIATGKPSTHVDIQPFNPSRYAGVIKIQ